MSLEFFQLIVTVFIELFFLTKMMRKVFNEGVRKMKVNCFVEIIQNTGISHSLSSKRVLIDGGSHEASSGGVWENLSVSNR
jgi:hypothetical protein